MSEDDLREQLASALKTIEQLSSVVMEQAEQLTALRGSEGNYGFPVARTNRDPRSVN